MEQSKPRSFLDSALVFAALMTIWMVFSGKFDAFHLSLGLISCGFVTWMSGDLLIAGGSSLGLGRRVVRTFRFASYFLWLLWQIVLANIAVLKLAFSPRSALQPQIVWHKTTLKTDLQKYLLANSITLTPGTITVRICGDMLCIHAIDDASAEGINGEMDRRIAHIFEDSPV